MRVFPFRRVVLDTPHGPDEVLARLGNRLDRPGTVVWPWSSPRRPLRGVIDHRHFAVTPNVSDIGWGSGVRMLGEVERRDGGSRIRATIRYGRLGTAICGLLGAFAVVMLGVLVALALEGDPLEGGTLPACLLPASLYVLTVGVLNWGISRSVKVLQAAIQP
jgi:hypothetical protein